MSRSLVQQLRDENAFLRERVRALEEAILVREARPTTPRKLTPEEETVERAIASRSFDAPTERANRQYAQTMRARGWTPDQIAAQIERGVAPASTLEQDLGAVVR